MKEDDGKGVKALREENEAGLSNVGGGGSGAGTRVINHITRSLTIVVAYLE